MPPQRQTLRQAKAAYKKSATLNPISDRERRQISRNVELEERAERIRDAERRRKEAQKKKAERERREEEARRRTGVGLATQLAGFSHTQMQLKRGMESFLGMKRGNGGDGEGRVEDEGGEGVHGQEKRSEEEFAVKAMSEAEKRRDDVMEQQEEPWDQKELTDVYSRHLQNAPEEKKTDEEMRGEADQNPTIPHVAKGCSVDMEPWDENGIDDAAMLDTFGEDSDLDEELSFLCTQQALQPRMAQALPLDAIAVRDFAPGSRSIDRSPARKRQRLSPKQISPNVASPTNPRQLSDCWDEFVDSNTQIERDLTNYKTRSTPETRLSSGIDLPPMSTQDLAFSPGDLDELAVVPQSTRSPEDAGSQTVSQLETPCPKRRKPVTVPAQDRPPDYRMMLPPPVPAILLCHSPPSMRKAGFGISTQQALEQLADSDITI